MSTIPIRLSHLLGYCSVGAIVRGPEYLLIVEDIRRWTDRQGQVVGEQIRYVDRVVRALNISPKILREPPLACEQKNGQIDGVCIPALRFPFWMRCTNGKCEQKGFLRYKPWKNTAANEYPRCPTCRRELEQVPWVMVHPAGYIADVPWHFLAHSDKGSFEQQQCKADWSEPYLRLVDQQGAKRRLRCGRCKAFVSFEEPFEKFKHIPLRYGRTRPQPWEKDLPLAAGVEELPVEIIEINDARVHSAVTRSALVIPPAFYQALVRMGFENFYVVADQNQRIVDGLNSSRQDIQNCLGISAAEVVELRENYRNTYPVAHFAQSFYTGDPASPKPELPTGRPSSLRPLLYAYAPDGFDAVIKRILIAADNDPQQLIGVIAPNNKVRERYLDALGSVEARLEHGRPPVSTYYRSANASLPFNKGGIMVINAHSCKGLEFDTVFLADINEHFYDTRNPDSARRLFYVMAARARNHLILLREKDRPCPVDAILSQDPLILERK